MSLAYPLGLLGLIGVPILILIYIIKNQYTEKVIASTYLWELSERFLKKRLPISRIVGIISLILQILAVVFASLALAQPVFTIPDAGGVYCFVLDGTGSMNYEAGGTTRFDAGKKEIRSVIKNSMKGSAYTLVYVGDATETVFEYVSDKDRAIAMLDELEVGYRADDLNKAWETAQEFFDSDPSTKVYLITDKRYEGTENVTVVNVAEERADNFSLSDIEVVTTPTENSSHITVSGTVMSYVNDGDVEISLYFDDETEPHATVPLEVLALIPSAYTFEVDDVADFRAVRVTLGTEDGLSLDDEAVYYNVEFENSSRTLLVSERPFFLKAALIAAGTSQVTVIDPSEYEGQTGYDLFVFEQFMPETLPADGAVWFVNPQSGVAGSNFSYQGSQSAPREGLAYSNSTNSGVRNLLEGVPGAAARTEYELKQYVKCGLGAKFSILLTCEGNPMLFTGATESGAREVVFAFDPRDSAPFILSADFNVLVDNLLDYTFPPVVEETGYVCGETLAVNVVAGCTSMRIVSPNGKESFPDTSVPIVEYTLNEVGTYDIELYMADGSVRTINVYSSLAEAERAPSETEAMRVIYGTPESGGRDGVYDDLLYLFIILALLAAAEYGVYCYEQYQLR